MAGNKLSLAIAINLLTENFKKGKNNVVSGLKSMQVRVMTFIAALGFGSIGLSNFVSKLISVAKETSRVTTALKNVSGGLANYAANQKFVNEIANKYGLEVNALTNNFAKFTASASAGNMAIDKQQKIFESAARASAAFNLTAADTDSVFRGLYQMMGKGKVASQELRLQIGEKLPIAVQAMANALGVSISEMEKMMASGKLLANDVLPKFADALDKLTPSVDLDNINTSLNRLENNFGILTEKLGVESKFKKIVDTINNGVIALANNLKTVFSALFLGIFFIATHNIVKIGKAWDALAMGQVDTSKKLHAKLVAAEAKKEAELVAVQKARMQYEVSAGTSKIKNLEKLRIAEKKFGMAVIAEEKARIAYTEGASAKKVGIATRGMNAIKIGATKLGMALKSLWVSFAPAMVLTALASVVMYFKNIYSESKRIANIRSEYNKRLSEVTSTDEIVKLKTTLKLYNEAKGNLAEQKKFKEELVKISGEQITKEEDINKVIAKRIKLLENQAKVDFMTREKLDIEKQIKEKSRELSIKYDFDSKDVGSMNPFKSIPALFKLSKVSGLDPETKNQLDELKALKESHTSITSDLQDLMKEIVLSSNTNTSSSSSSSSGTKSDELTKLEEKYAQSLRELEVKLQHGIIKQDEYNQSKDELIKSAFVEAKSSKDLSIVNSKFSKKLEEQLKQPLYNAQQAEIAKIQEDHGKAVEALSNQKKNTQLSEKEYNSKLLDLINKTVEQIGAMSNLTDAQKEYILNLQKQGSTLAVKEAYKPEKRDTTFDYKKTKIDIQSEELDVAKKNYAQLKDLASENLKEFEGELTSMMSNIKGLDEALKLAQVREDIKELNKEVTRGTLATADSMVSGVNNVVQSIQRINDAFSSTDASGWERIMALWEGIMSTVDSFLQIIDLIERLSQVTQMLTTAKQTEAAVDTATTTAKIANMAAETAAVNATVAEQTVVETTASSIKKTAATGEMAAKSTAAYASIPFAGPALAAAQIAAFTAMIAAASIPKFKDGGIIGGGATSGDQMLARVNAGEMILNKPQQGNLWKMLNSTSRVRGESLEVGGKVRGADIHLALKNYMRSTGKTL